MFLQGSGVWPANNFKILKCPGYSKRLRPGYYFPKKSDKLFSPRLENKTQGRHESHRKPRSSFSCIQGRIRGTSFTTYHVERYLLFSGSSLCKLMSLPCRNERNPMVKIKQTIDMLWKKQSALMSSTPRVKHAK